MVRPKRDGDLALDPQTAKPKPPELYKVLLLNDDYTPMEFVVSVIEQFFFQNPRTSHANHAQSTY